VAVAAAAWPACKTTRPSPITAAAVEPSALHALLIIAQWLTVKKSVIRFRCKQMPLRMDVIHTTHQMSDRQPGSAHRMMAMTSGSVSFKVYRSDAVDDTRIHVGCGCLRIRNRMQLGPEVAAPLSVRTVSPGLFTR
jgi:hypothetical protein